MYKLKINENFEEIYKKLTKGNLVLKKQFEKVFQLLSLDPFYPSLKSHKVDTKRNKNVWSSWVSGDIRLIWAFDENDNLVILILDTGSHSSSNQIYKNKSN